MPDSNPGGSFHPPIEGPETFLHMGLHPDHVGEVFRITSVIAALPDDPRGAQVLHIMVDSYLLGRPLHYFSALLLSDEPFEPGEIDGFYDAWVCAFLQKLGEAVEEDARTALAEVGRPRNVRVGFLHQEYEGAGFTPLDVGRGPTNTRPRDGGRVDQQDPSADTDAP